MTERLVDIVTNELRNDYNKLEDDLEQVINSGLDSMDTNEKVNKIKSIVKEMGSCEMSLQIWNRLRETMEEANQSGEQQNES